MKRYLIPDLKIRDTGVKREEEIEIRLKQTFALVEQQFQTKFYCPCRSSIEKGLDGLKTKTDNLELEKR